MSNSPYVDYTKLSPNCYANRGGAKIRKITPHHMAGNLTVEACGQVFQNKSHEASSNYGIGTDGRIGLYVPESKAAWTSSSYSNDTQAVTIEVANSKAGGNWPVSAKAWNALVALCVDICRRNGIKSLSWTGDKSGSLTCHYMFAPTGCPGPYLKGRMAKLANAVNKELKKTARKYVATKGCYSYTRKLYNKKYRSRKIAKGTEFYISKTFKGAKYLWGQLLDGSWVNLTKSFNAA